jgi:hypothetical protein
MMNIVSGAGAVGAGAASRYGSGANKMIRLGYTDVNMMLSDYKMSS